MTPAQEEKIDDLAKAVAALSKQIDGMGHTLLGELDADGVPKDRTHLSNAMVIAEIRKDTGK